MHYKVTTDAKNESIVVEFYEREGGELRATATLPVEGTTKQKVEETAKTLAVEWQVAQAAEIAKQNRVATIAQKIAAIEALFPSSRSLTQKEVNDFKRDNNL